MGTVEHSPIVTPVKAADAMKKKDLVEKFGLVQKNYEVTYTNLKKVELSVKLAVAYVDLGKFLTALFRYPSWQQLYDFTDCQSATALLYWDGTPVRKFAIEKEKKGQVSGMYFLVLLSTDCWFLCVFILA
jgi:hypothetical protein